MLRALALVAAWGLPLHAQAPTRSVTEGLLGGAAAVYGRARDVVAGSAASTTGPGATGFLAWGFDAVGRGWLAVAPVLEIGADIVSVNSISGIGDYQVGSLGPALRLVAFDETMPVRPWVRAAFTARAVDRLVPTATSGHHQALGQGSRIGAGLWWFVTPHLAVDLGADVGAGTFGTWTESGTVVADPSARLSSLTAHLGLVVHAP